MAGMRTLRNYGGTLNLKSTCGVCLSRESLPPVKAIAAVFEQCRVSACWPSLTSPWSFVVDSNPEQSHFLSAKAVVGQNMVCMLQPLQEITLFQFLPSWLI